MTQRRAENTLANLSHSRLVKLPLIKGGKCSTGVAFNAKFGMLKILDGPVSDLMARLILSLRRLMIFIILFFYI